LQNLLQYHQSSPLLSLSERCSIGRALFSALLSFDRAWIAGASMRCATVRVLFLEVLETCVEYMEAVSAAPKDRKRLLFLAAAAADPGSPAQKDEFEGIAVDVLRANAASMVLRCACTLDASSGPPSVDLTSLLVAISTRGSIAVQESFLWTLRRCLTMHFGRMEKQFDLKKVAKHVMEEKILRHTKDFVSTSESNYTIQELSLQLLMIFQTSLPVASLSYRLSAHWNELLTWTVNSTSNHVKGEAFIVLSSALDSEFSDLSHSGAEGLKTFLAHASIWMELLQGFMDDEQPVALRYACVNAIQASGMLKGRVLKSKLALPAATESQKVDRVLPPLPFSSTSPLLSLQVSYDSIQSVSIMLWSSVILHLLQDENETVRTDISTLVGGILDPAASATLKDDDAPSFTGCTLVTRVLEQTFAFLHTHYASSPLLRRCLREYLTFYARHFQTAHEINPATAVTASSPSPSPSADPSPAAVAPSSSPSSSVFKLFEHEKANTVVEELLLIELAAYYLAKGYEVNGAASPETKELILTDLESSSAAVLQALAEFTSSSSSSGWIGGGSFLEEPFVRICGELHRLASVLPIVTRGDFASDARVQPVVAALEAASLSERAREVHPLMARVLVNIDAQRRSAATNSASVGFLTNVVEA
jgi:hypothetical protein